jgi:hypothetical protein
MSGGARKDVHELAGSSDKGLTRLIHTVRAIRRVPHCISVHPALFCIKVIVVLKMYKKTVGLSQTNLSRMSSS